MNLSARVLVLSLVAFSNVAFAGPQPRTIAARTAASAAVKEAELRTAKRCRLTDIKSSSAAADITIHVVEVACQRSGMFTYRVTVEKSLVGVGKYYVYRAISIQPHNGKPKTGN
jgi:hypothetical protein